MVLKVVVKIVITLAIFDVTSSTISTSTPHTTAGRRFLFNIQSLHVDERGEGPAWVRVYTEETKATVMVSKIKSVYDLSGDRNYYRIEVSRDKSHWLKFSGEGEFLLSSGIFQALELIADVPISSVVHRYGYKQSPLGSFAYNLLPMHTWSTSYYASTQISAPYILVLTPYDLRFRITFPKLNNTFRTRCTANYYCSAGKTTVVRLKSLQSWYFYHKDSKSTFQNAVIESDRPVYVVSGNGELDTAKSSSWDGGGTSVRPTNTWGKEYIIPHFIYTQKSKNGYTTVQITAENFPFEYTLLYGGRTKSGKLLQSDNIKIVPFKSSAIVSAGVPFGLYQFLSSPSNPGNLDLIPIEQWMGGTFFYHVDHKDLIKSSSGKWTIINMFYTTSGKKTIIFEGKASVSWEKPIEHEKHTYNYGVLTISKYPVSIYSTDPKGRVMVYTNYRAVGNKADGYFPDSSYTANIYDPDCFQTDAFSADGIDNDCDGFVDEEWENGDDDDGDGLIDEDFIQKPGHHEWGPWTTLCSTECGGKKVEKKIRDCKTNKYGFAKGKTCDGQNTMCSPGPICPKSCKPDPKCGCLSGCSNSSCVVPTLPHCSECNEGYAGMFCLLPCSPGWRGKDCALHPLTKDYPAFGTRAWERELANKGTSRSSIVSIIAILILLAVAVLLLVLIIGKKQMEVWTGQDNGQEEEHVEGEQGKEEHVEEEGGEHVEGEQHVDGEEHVEGEKHVDGEEHVKAEEGQDNRRSTK